MNRIIIFLMLLGCDAGLCYAKNIYIDFGISKGWTDYTINSKTTICTKNVNGECLQWYDKTRSLRSPYGIIEFYINHKGNKYFLSHISSVKDNDHGLNLLGFKWGVLNSDNYTLDIGMAIGDTDYVATKNPKCTGYNKSNRCVKWAYNTNTINSPFILLNAEFIEHGLVFFVRYINSLPDSDSGMLLGGIKYRFQIN